MDWEEHMAVLVDNLENNVIENVKASDHVTIITGYFSPDIIEKIAQLGIPLTYYYGMYGIDKISKPVYDKLVAISNQYPCLQLKFVNTQRVHTKCYLFYKNIFFFYMYISLEKEVWLITLKQVYVFAIINYQKLRIYQTYL